MVILIIHVFSLGIKIRVLRTTVVNASICMVSTPPESNVHFYFGVDIKSNDLWNSYFSLTTSSKNNGWNTKNIKVYSSFPWHFFFFKSLVNINPVVYRNVNISWWYLPRIFKQLLQVYDSPLHILKIKQNVQLLLPFDQFSYDLQGKERKLKRNRSEHYVLW